MRLFLYFGTCGRKYRNKAIASLNSQSPRLFPDIEKHQDLFPRCFSRPGLRLFGTFFRQKPSVDKQNCRDPGERERMIKHGDRAAGNRRLAEAVDRCLHKNICQTKHRTLYCRGQAIFAARTRGKGRSFRFAGFISYSPRYPIHDLGGFHHHGDGGKGNGNKHTARFDIKARPVQNRNTPAGRVVLPLNRARNEKQKKPDSRSSKIYRISSIL